MSAAIIVGVIAVICISAFGIADAVAYSYTKVDESEWDYVYYFDEGQKDEAATGSNPDVQVIEKFTRATADNIIPGQCFSKVIDVKSGADFDAYAYIMLEIETVSAYKAGDEDPQVYDSAEAQINTEDWEKVYEAKASASGESSVYIYRYKKILEAGKSTETENNTESLCQLFKVPEFTDIDGAERNITARAYIIQSMGFTSKEADTEAISALTK